MDRRQNDGAARVDGNVHFVSDFNAREIHQGSIKDDPLRVSDFGDGLGHPRNTMFYKRQLSTRQKTQLQRPMSGCGRSNQVATGCKATARLSPVANLPDHPTARLEIGQIHGSNHIFTMAGRRDRMVIPIHGNQPLKKRLLRSLMKISGLQEHARCPHSLAATLAALPSMSLIPSAPFQNSVDASESRATI